MRALGRFHEYATACDELPREERRVREALEVYPDHKGLRYGVIELLIRGRRFAEAMAEIERAAVDFGLDDATLDAGLEIRRFAGPGEGAIRGKGSVSVCMIVKDEAQHLPSALLSVKGFADEIIVVDTGSSDRTADIARLFGARLFSFPWNGSFSDARNFSLSQASGDWIFILDADEVLAASDLAPLTALVKRTVSPAAFSIVTRNYTDEITRKNWSANAGEYHAEERGRGWTPSEKVRLFPNDSRVRFDGAVHELLELSLMRCAIPIIACDVPVHHYGKLDAARNLEKHERYYQLGLKKMNQTGGTIEALTELAVQATELKRYREAENLWQKVLQARPESVDARFNLGYLHLSQGDYRKARRYAIEAAELVPAMKEAAFNLAKCDFFLGALPEALSRCEEMLQNVPDYPPALSLLSVTLLLMGRKREALSLVERLRSMGFDCCDFLFEYADGLKKGEAAHLAAPLLELAAKLAGTAVPPGVEGAGNYCHA
jgi:O-antigen biosynthesis protein